MTREEQLACLTDRPCAVCSKHTDKGCSSWNCVFEEKPEDTEIIFCKDCAKRRTLKCPFGITIFDAPHNNEYCSRAERWVTE